MQRDHGFYTTMAFVMTGVVFIGFARTYSARLAAGTTTPLIHLHGAIFAAWMILYIAQSVLVLRGHTRLHRKVGVAGTFFAAALLVVGAVTGVVAARHGYRGPLPDPPTPIVFLLIAPVRDMLVFGGLAGAAIAMSRDIQAHKRLMLMATLGGLVPAGASRLPGGTVVFVSVFLLMLAAGPAYDWIVRRKVHIAYVWGLTATIGSTILFAVLSGTSAWDSFAHALID